MSKNQGLTGNEPAGFYEENWFLLQFFKYLFMPVYRPFHWRFLSLVGRENVVEAFRLYRDESKNIVLIANHRSSVDVWIIQTILWLNGFRWAETIFFYFVGLRFFIHRFFRWMIKAGPRIVVLPPTLVEQILEQLKSSNNHRPSPEERRRFHAEAAKVRRINDRAIEAAQEQFRQGRWAFLFPEGSRSRTGRMIKANPVFLDLVLGKESAEHSSLVFLPTALIGTWEIWRPGTYLNPLRIRNRVTLIVGKPIPIQNLWTEARKLAVAYNLKSVKEAASELLMESIAHLLKEQGFTWLCGDYIHPISTRLQANRTVAEREKKEALV